MNQVEKVENEREPKKVEFVGMIASQGLCKIPWGCLIGLWKIDDKNVWIEDLLSALSLQQLFALYQRIQYELDRWAE